MHGFLNTLLSADADSVCGVGYGVRDAERVNRRIGYRCRELDTRVGTLTVIAAGRRHMVSVNDEPPTVYGSPTAEPAGHPCDVPRRSHDPASHPTALA
jgi:hypothetical protein